jgi:sec-independent protein translocase protein TatA
MGFFQNLTGWHALILLAIVLLLFGATRLPALARSIGQSMSIFRSEVKDRAEPEPASETSSSTPLTPGTSATDPRTSS